MSPPAGVATGVSTGPEAVRPDGVAGWGAMSETDAARTLSRMLAADRLPHALLFAGPEDVGKAQLATALAQSLNCTERAAGAGDPCGACRSCRRIAEAKHADVETVAPGGLCRVNDHDHAASPNIGICQIRRLEMVAVSNPYEGRRRVFLIDPAETMTADAADAFLKTLEEPPEAVTLILITAAPARLSETVRSRCRRVDVVPLMRSALTARLSQREDVSAEDAASLAGLARGRAGWALNALAEGDPVQERRSQIDELRRVSAADAAERLDFAQSLAGRRGDTGPALTMMEAWREWWRDLLRVRLGAADGVTHVFLRDLLAADAPSYAPREIVAFLRELQTTEELLRIGVQVRVALEALMLAVPRPAGAPESVRSAG